MKTSRDNKQNQPNIGLITLPVLKPNILFSFIKILDLLSSELFVITGNFPEDLIPSKNAHIRNIKNNKRESKWIFVRVIRYILTQLKLSINLIKISKNIDIVIFFVGGSALVLPMFTAKLLKKKTLLIISESTAKNVKMFYSEKLFGMGGIIFFYIVGLLEKINYTFSDMIILYSKNLIRQLDLNKYKGKIYSIGAPFVDTNLFSVGKKMEKRRDVIGYLGRFREEKGIMNFIDAISLILKECNNVSFFIGGDGSLSDKIKKELKRDRYYDKVILKKWIPHEKLPEYLNDLKLLVIPSYTETGPFIALEAAACGTPILATSVGLIPDIVKNGETGFILEDNSPECIAKNVVRVLNHPDLDGIAKNAHKIIEEKYTYKATVKRYEEILNSIMKNER